MVNFFQAMQYSEGIIFVLLYLLSALGRYLITNATGLIMVLSGTSSWQQLSPSLTCNRPVPSSIPEGAVSKYLLYHKTSCMHLF